MRIAIISQFSSPGGGARFLRGLCFGLLHCSDVEEIGLFVDSEAAGRDGLVGLLPDSSRLTIHLMDSHGDFADVGFKALRGLAARLRTWARSQPVIVRLYRSMRRLALGDTGEPPMPRVALSEQVVRAIGEYDVAYFPWPRQVVPPAAPAALVGTFHDFNHRHRFGNFREQDIAALDAEMVEWLEGRVHPICSTRFIARELDEYYPRRTNAPEVVYLTTFAIHDPAPGEVHTVMAELGLPDGFVLCPTNISPHKNLISLLRAAGKMKRSSQPLRLVVTGSGTQFLGRDASNDPLYESVLRESIDGLNAALAEENLILGKDIWPLGYVTDAQMDALVKGASLIVAPSRYEAGSGPALDAWWLGTPVVSSSLDPVVEQMGFLGTEAVLFEATDVDGMVEAITGLATHPEIGTAMVDRSQQAIRRYTWDDVGREYARVFKTAIDSASPPS